MMHPEIRKFYEDSGYVIAEGTCTDGSILWSLCLYNERENLLMMQGVAVTPQDPSLPTSYYFGLERKKGDNKFSEAEMLRIIKQKAFF